MGKAWEKLKKGDIVDLVAPAYGVNKKDLETAQSYIESLGLVPRTPAKIHGKDLFHSNTDGARLKYLKYALYSDDSNAVWCLKGGYGTARLLPELDKLSPPPKAKLVIGFSDITSLHIFLTQKWGWNSLHGPVLWQIATDRISDSTKSRLKKVLFGQEKNQTFDIKPLSKKIPSEISGEVIGGNLTLIQNSIGTCWQIETKNKILLIEEVDEEPYRVDRMLLHFQQAGVLKGAKAIVFGDFSSDDKKMDLKKINAVHERFASEIKIPVFKVNNIGHGKNNHPVPFGTKAIIRNGKLSCETGYK